MENNLLFLVLGGFIAYIGALLQHFFESKRQKKSEIRKEKLKIYGETLSQLNSCMAFNPKDGMRKELFDPDYLHKLRLKLGSSLSRARLMASPKLEEELRDLYDLEIAWREKLISNPDSEECEKLNKQSADQVIRVERLMRKEVQE